MMQFEEMEEKTDDDFIADFNVPQRKFFFSYCQLIYSEHDIDSNTKFPNSFLF